MFGDRRAGRQSRAGSAIIALAVQVALVLVIWRGFAPPGLAARAMAGALTAIAMAPEAAPRPKPQPQPAHPRTYAASGKASPANIRAKAAPVVAAALPLINPPPIPAATRPATGSQSQSGAAPRPGPGSGAGGLGLGTGAGADGDGEGDSDAEAELMHGDISARDYPKTALDAHAQGTTETRITVAASGQPTACRVTRSSGNADLDRTTCTLALRRFRFRPARDLAGRAIVGSADFDEAWTVSGQWDTAGR